MPQVSIVLSSPGQEREEDVAWFTDGRRRRGQRTRSRIIDVTRRLMRTGCWQPTSANIATEAGVSMRALFQHFASMQNLYAVALEDAELSREIAARLLGATFPQAWAGPVVRLIIGGPPEPTLSPMATMSSEPMASASA
ncbi:TetR/AcrR family transcriptional regulator [Reyranella sp. CPCC 100927]|uniref:TetR/AcrR family transcriptional regulator n=1 Tax=Reyranella sp. CPCC 100927 TaxID=2599616 RepID=UPI0011B44B7E|nr:TetR family transcriptional regulator [Reyranella sp. CPCC 100927]TWS95113.1 helix-turn-helix transcriptional regulator [Reyranella sp. CPCC 100927]